MAPIGTRLNVSDLNTKKLTAARKRFLLFFLGATRFDESSGTQESIGEAEFIEYMTEEALKAQVRRLGKLAKNKTSRGIFQVAMALSAFGLKGCVEQNGKKLEETSGNSWQQFALTVVVLLIIALCNFVFSHWEVIQTLLDRRGRKRKREPEIPDNDNNDADVEVEELEVQAGEQASASTGPVPPTEPPPLGPPPRAPKFSPIPVDPPPRWDPWSPEWFIYYMLGRVNRRLQRRGHSMDHNT